LHGESVSRRMNPLHTYVIATMIAHTDPAKRL
jgi:hypothetical protein